MTYHLQTDRPLHAAYGELLGQSGRLEAINRAAVR
jgi:hypothetical protein